MNDLTEALKMILDNPDTAWIGYAALVLVLISIALTLISGFLVKIVTNFREVAKQLRPKKPDYKKQIKMEADVSAILRNIRHDLHADRVCILQYHNGVHSIADNSLLKLSMSHESLSLNVRSVMQEVQNWFANSLGSINSEIFDGRYIKHVKVHEMDDEPELRSVSQYLKQNGVKSIYCFPVTDVYGKTFGIGIVQYTRKEYDLDGEWIRWARDRFIAVGTLLAGVEKEESVK